MLLISWIQSRLTTFASIEPHMGSRSCRIDALCFLQHSYLVYLCCWILFGSVFPSIPVEWLAGNTIVKWPANCLVRRQIMLSLSLFLPFLDFFTSALCLMSTVYLFRNAVIIFCQFACCVLKDNSGQIGVLLWQLEEKNREVDEGQYMTCWIFCMRF